MRGFVKYGMIAASAMAVACVVTFAVGRSSPPPPRMMAKVDPALEQPIRVIQTVKIEPTSKPAPEPPAAPPPGPKAEPVVKEATADEERPRRHRTRSERRSRGDVCSRHNMRKVMVGRYRWRCRK
jgi:hypothetical protein